MGIYFRDILLIRISRGANNYGQHSLAKNIYFIMRFSPHFQLFYFNDRLEFCEFFEWKIKRINNADLFSQPPLLIFIKGANISGGHCKYKNKTLWKSYLHFPLLSCVCVIWGHKFVQWHGHDIGITRRRWLMRTLPHVPIFQKAYK